MANTYPLSDGTRLSKPNIDANIRHAKSVFVAMVVDQGKQYCWACGHTGVRLSCSHIISVNDCQRIGKSELAYDIDNLQMECIGCHASWENRAAFWKHANYSVKKKYIQKHFKELYTKLYGEGK